MPVKKRILPDLVQINSESGTASLPAVNESKPKKSKLVKTTQADGSPIVHTCRSKGRSINRSGPSDDSGSDADVDVKYAPELLANLTPYEYQLLHTSIQQLNENERHERRKLQNRMASHSSRAKKTSHVAQLEAQVADAQSKLAEVWLSDRLKTLYIQELLTVLSRAGAFNNDGFNLSQANAPPRPFLRPINDYDLSNLIPTSQLGLKDELINGLNLFDHNQYDILPNFLEGVSTFDNSRLDDYLRAQYPQNQIPQPNFDTNARLTRRRAMMIAEYEHEQDVVSNCITTAPVNTGHNEQFVHNKVFRVPDDVCEGYDTDSDYASVPTSGQQSPQLSSSSSYNSYQMDQLINLDFEINTSNQNSNNNNNNNNLGEVVNQNDHVISNDNHNNNNVEFIPLIIPPAAAQPIGNGALNGGFESHITFGQTVQEDDVIQAPYKKVCLDNNDNDNNVVSLQNNAPMFSGLIPQPLMTAYSFQPFPLQFQDSIHHNIFSSSISSPSTSSLSSSSLSSALSSPMMCASFDISNISHNLALSPQSSPRASPFSPFNFLDDELPRFNFFQD
jgi:hypothetical protein